MCERAKKAEEKKMKEEYEQQQKKLKEEQAHLERMAKLEEEYAKQRAELENLQLIEERNRAFEQKQRDLEEFNRIVLSKRAQPTNPIPQPSQPPTVPPPLGAPIQGHNTATATPSNPVTSPPQNSNQLPPVGRPMLIAPNSATSASWEKMKAVKGVTNAAIDEIMGLIGLEGVKEQVIKIFERVETSLRQGTDLKKERFNVSMLGNPGTGMYLLPAIFIVD